MKWDQGHGYITVPNNAESANSVLLVHDSGCMSAAPR